MIRSSEFARARRKFPTGIPALDKATDGGLRSRQQSIAAGPTGVGKTSLVGTITNGLAQAHPVLWVCTELPAEEQAARLAALEMRRVRGGAMTPDALLSHEMPPEHAAKAVDGLPIYLQRLRRRDGDPFALIMQQAIAIRDRHHEPPIIVVDYLQKLACEDEQQRRLSVSAVSETLLDLAQDLDTHLLAISSVSRAFYNSTARKLRKQNEDEDPRDWLAVGKESGDLEYDAALLMYLDVGDEANAVGERPARLIVAKARGGGEGFYGLRFHGPSGLFVPDDAAAVTMKAGDKQAAAVNLDKIKTAVRRLFMKQRKKPFTSRSQIAGLVDARKQDALNAIDALFEDGDLTQEGTRGPITFTPPETET